MSEAWAPSFGPEPPYSPPSACPPNKAEYSFGPGSYASKMFWRGFIPMAGGILQKNVKKPPTVIDQNNQLRQNMQQTVALWEAKAGDQSISLWTDLNDMLQDVVQIGAAVSSLMVLPLQSRLMYLFAGVVALGLLSVAILMGI